MRPFSAFGTLLIQHLRPYSLFEALFSFWHPFHSTFETLFVIWNPFQHLTPLWLTFETLFVIWDPFQHLTPFSFNIWDLIRYLRPSFQHLRPFLFNIWDLIGYLRLFSSISHPFGGVGRPLLSRAKCWSVARVHLDGLCQTVLWEAEATHPGGGYFVERWVRERAAQTGCLSGLPIGPFYLKIGLDIVLMNFSFGVPKGCQKLLTHSQFTW